MTTASRPPSRAKRRIISAVEEQSATKLVAVECRPAAAGDPIAFLDAFKRELNRRQAVALDDSIVKIRFDRQKS